MPTANDKASNKCQLQVKELFATQLKLKKRRQHYIGVARSMYEEWQVELLYMLFCFIVKMKSFLLC